MHGGGTDYYTGFTSEACGTLAKRIPCQYGRLTVVCLDKMIHSVEAWEESRGCINFNLKQRVLEDFLKYGMKYYTQYVSNNYPSEPFFSCIYLKLDTPIF